MPTPSLSCSEGTASRHAIMLLSSLSPRVFFSDAESNMKPKLEFFLGAGVSYDSLVKLIAPVLYFLRCYLEKKLLLNLQITGMAICENEKQMLANMYKFAWVSNPNSEKKIFEVLPSCIIKFSTLRPQVLLLNPNRFSKSAVSRKETAFDLSALHHVSGLKKLWLHSDSSWEKLIWLYQSFVWSIEDTISVFNQFFLCMMISDKKFERAVNIFVEIVDCTPSFLATQSIHLCFRPEMRTVLLDNGMNILNFKGLEKNFSMTTIFHTIKKWFLEKYINEYKDQDSDFLVAYKVKIDPKCLKFSH